MPGAFMGVAFVLLIVIEYLMLREFCTQSGFEKFRHAHFRFGYQPFIKPQMGFSFSIV